MQYREVFVALGGNIGDTESIFQKALDAIADIPAVKDLSVSRYYRTTPVSPIPQNFYLNAVCRFETALSAHDLLQRLQYVEVKLGKQPKPKEAARVIDLDILFFGNENHVSPDLEIPHPKWNERLFVLQPLADLTDQVVIPGKAFGTSNVVNLAQCLKNFKNPYNEIISLHQPFRGSHGTSSY